MEHSKIPPTERQKKSVANEMCGLPIKYVP